MPSYSMNELTTYRWSFEEELLQIRNAGYDGLGIWLRKLFDFGEERAIDLLDESGLAVSSVSWIGGFTGADASTARENIALAREAIMLSAELRADCIVMYSGGRNLHTRRHTERLLASALDALLPVAEEHGVPIALEPMHAACAAEWTFLTGLEETLRLIDKFQSDALKVSLDTYHFPLKSADKPLVDELVSHLGVVAVGDFLEPRGIDHARVPLGEGESPLGKTLGLLRDAGYQGAYDVKLIGPEIEARDYQQLLRESLQTLDQLLTLPAATPQRTTAPLESEELVTR